MKIIKIGRFLFYFISLFIVACVDDYSTEEELLFRNTKNSNINLKIDSNSYFLKNFELELNPTKISNQNYWRLKCDPSSFFYLAGFLTKDSNTIYFLPTDYSTGKANRKVLFSFSSPIGSRWHIYLNSEGNIINGDSIIYNGFSKQGADSLYSFSFYPFQYYKKNNIKSFSQYYYRLDVDKNKGIKNIYTCILDPEMEYILFIARLFPQAELIDKRHGLLVL